MLNAEFQLIFLSDHLADIWVLSAFQSSVSECLKDNYTINKTNIGPHSYLEYSLLKPEYPTLVGCQLYTRSVSARN